MSTIIAIFFSIWLILTILYQIEEKKLQKVSFIFLLDFFSLIPRWTFFAPNPGKSDNNILYRDIWFNGIAGNWKEVKGFNEVNVIKAFWNPSKRLNKALFDIVNMLLSQATQIKSPEKDREVEISLPYIVLINFISQQVHHSLAVKTQFLILESFGFAMDKEPELKVLSSIHRLDNK